MRLRFRYSVIVGRVLVLIQVGSASPRRRQAHAPLTEPFNYTRKTKPRTEGEAAAKPLGGLSPFPAAREFSFLSRVLRLRNFSPTGAFALSLRAKPCPYNSLRPNTKNHRIKAVSDLPYRLRR